MPVHPSIRAINWESGSTTTPREDDTRLLLGAWLSALPHVERVRTSSVTLAKVTYYAAAHYWQTGTTPEGSRAYSEGQREYIREMVYVVGALPRSYLRGRAVYRFPGDARDWYVACYAGIVKNRIQEPADVNEYHPFGQCFMLAPWDIAGSTVDDGEKVRRERLSAGPGLNNPSWIPFVPPADPASSSSPLES